MKEPFSDENECCGPGAHARRTMLKARVQVEFRSPAAAFGWRAQFVVCSLHQSRRFAIELGSIRFPSLDERPAERTFPARPRHCATRGSVHCPRGSCKSYVL